MSTVTEVAEQILDPEHLAWSIRRARLLHSLSPKWASRRRVRDLVEQRRAGGVG